MDYNFKHNGQNYTATDANWAKNGMQAWDILDENEDFVATVFVHPFECVEMSVEKWVEMEACYA